MHRPKSVSAFSLPKPVNLGPRIISKDYQVDQPQIHFELPDPQHYLALSMQSSSTQMAQEEEKKPMMRFPILEMILK